MKQKLEDWLLYIFIGLIVLVFIIAVLWYHFDAPCSWHKRIDTSQQLPARCNENVK